ncbi:MAG: TVP38/TMEM64 family protein, partial [Candidatus Poribacteria bacterium]|nr:TVP38/TMEM64 family protein [Candidatus Poribacteria bacterium]
ALTVMAGALFGSVLGVAYVSVASTLGAASAFLVARYFARDAIKRRLEQNDKFQRLDALAASQGTIIVAVTRLVPLFPFNLLNYGFGLTGVSFWTYIGWSWLCMLPGTALYVVGADAFTKGLAEGRVPWELIGALAFVIALLALLVRTARKRLGDSTERE